MKVALDVWAGWLGEKWVWMCGLRMLQPRGALKGG
jgi:hypothetical protein